LVIFNLLGHGDFTPIQCPRKPAPPQIFKYGELMKSKKIAFYSCFALILVAGCATSSGKQVYKTNDNLKMLISGNSALGKIYININGEAVIEGVGIYDKENLNGEYKGHKVVARCKMHTKAFGSDQECDVFIDEEYAANLYFH
jgi:hypothetical protein